MGAQIVTPRTRDEVHAKKLALAEEAFRKHELAKSDEAAQRWLITRSGDPDCWAEIVRIDKCVLVHGDIDIVVARGSLESVARLNEIELAKASETTTPSAWEYDQGVALADLSGLIEAGHDNRELLRIRERIESGWWYVQEMHRDLFDVLNDIDEALCIGRVPSMRIYCARQAFRTLFRLLKGGE